VLAPGNDRLLEYLAPGNYRLLEYFGPCGAWAVRT
jgi:hypothetical protein